MTCCSCFLCKWLLTSRLRDIPVEQVEDPQKHFKTLCIVKLGHPKSYQFIKRYLLNIEAGLLTQNIFFFYCEKKRFF